MHCFCTIGLYLCALKIIIVMDREQLYEEFITNCENSEPIQFPGQGNPNKDILIIGKESTDVTDSLISEKIRLCRDRIMRDAPRIIDTSNDTWMNYQHLCDMIYQRKSNYPDYWDFEKECAFTTELNNNPSKKTTHPNKKTKKAIEQRLKLFKSSNFIQSFPIVILACSNYITNQGEGNERQIDSTFNVEYDGEHNGGKHKFTSMNWFFTHHNVVDTKYFKAGEKLVIHTRQLSQNIKEDMLIDMAKVIRKHLGIE